MDYFKVCSKCVNIAILNRGNVAENANFIATNAKFQDAKTRIFKTLIFAKITNAQSLIVERKSNIIVTNVIIIASVVDIRIAKTIFLNLKLMLVFLIITLVIV